MKKMPMSLLKWVSCFVFSVAIVLPLLLGQITTWTDSHGFFDVAYYLENLRILVWPSSLLLLSLSRPDGDISYIITTYAMAFFINILLYSAVGSFIWWGIFKKRWILAIPATMLALLWTTVYLKFIG